ncbi:hypothetical protein CDIK_0710 [Cucumispora dikerogammari]|nr:hypothetical protein CDIK_0710 [Cucumispora dikerogammari]
MAVEELTMQTTKLTPELIISIKNDIKPIILSISILICISLSTLGSSIGITESATALSLLIHHPGVQIYVYVIGAFTLCPFLLTLLGVIMKKEYFKHDIPIDKVFGVSARLVAFGITNLAAGYAMGKVSHDCIKMVVKDKTSSFKIYMIYSLLELIVIFGFINLLL